MIQEKASETVHIYRNFQEKNTIVHFVHRSVLQLSQHEVYAKSKALHPWVQESTDTEIQSIIYPCEKEE